ncbi:MAG: hypothetical protein H8D45_24680 [Bacteroidetes bacterium]|nr:hypothetical protein [Bacteroidota bacterium]MBL7105245.1 hypothetical protein [Bacteroidales bacterium]
MITQKDIELINKYLDKSLSEGELKEFQSKFKTDPEFAREVKIHTDAMITLKAAASVHADDIHVRTPVIPFCKRYKYPIAAVFVLLIGLSILIYFFGGRKTFTVYQLYSEYFQLPADLITVNSSDNLVFSQRYRTENNLPVSQIIKFAPEDLNIIESDFQQLFLAGLYFMHINDLNNSILVFQKITKGKPNIYQEEASWYLGLAYLKSCQPEEAIIQFEILQQRNSYNAKQASELIKKIRSIKQPCN